jgi:hypothetical protein
VDSDESVGRHSAVSLPVLGVCEGVCRELAESCSVVLSVISAVGRLPQGPGADAVPHVGAVFLPTVRETGRVARASRSQGETTSHRGERSSCLTTSQTSNHRTSTSTSRSRARHGRGRPASPGRRRMWTRSTSRRHACLWMTSSTFPPRRHRTSRRIDSRDGRRITRRIGGDIMVVCGREMAWLSQNSGMIRRGKEGNAATTTVSSNASAARKVSGYART